MKSFICCCPGEAYKIERFLAWAGSAWPGSQVYVLALPARQALGESLRATFPRMQITVLPYPACRVADHYDPLLVDDALRARLPKTGEAEGVVFPHTAITRVRYMPDYFSDALKPSYNYFRLMHRLGIHETWVYDGNGPRKFALPLLLDDFVDRHRGEPAWVVGNGPSLKSLNLDPLRDAVTLGSNRVYMGFKDWGFEFKYWGIVDTLQFEKYLPEWEANLSDDIVKFYPIEYLPLFQVKNGVPVNFYPPGHPENKTNYNDPLLADLLKQRMAFSKDPDVTFLGYTVTYPLLQIAALMGCDPIYVIGMDHNYVISKDEKKQGVWSDDASSNHFHKNYGKSGGGAHQFHLPQMEGIESACDFAQSWAQKNERRIINCTPGTKLNSFPKQDYNDVVRSLAVRRPARPLVPKADGRSATILICTPDVNSELARRCVESVKRHTTGVPYELLIFENGRFGNFQHPREINRVLEVGLGDVVVTLDDDVEVTEGWLEAMLAAATPDVGIVGCVNLQGGAADPDHIRSVAVVVQPDGSAVHYRERITRPVAVPCCCSCCWLINDRDLRFDLRYEKYYQEGDICLASWERGKKVMVVPTGIYHMGQGQMEALGFTRDAISRISAADRGRFVQQWITTGRMQAVYDEIKDLVCTPLPDFIVKAPA
jgi:hypothetical protein